MNDAILQVLLIIAYLAIGLLSITFPVYAISISYLKQEKSETDKEIKRRKAKLKKELDIKIEHIEDTKVYRETIKSMKEHRKIINRIRERFLYLTLQYAVIIPTLSCIMALFMIFWGIQRLYLGNESDSWGAAVASFSLCWLALISLLSTLVSAQRAALRIARTVEYEVTYRSGNKDESVKVSEITEIDILVGAKEDLEYLSIHIFIPPEIKLIPREKGEIYPTQPEGLPYAGYSVILLETNFVHADDVQSYPFRIQSKKIRDYKIPVLIKAKGAFKYETELILNIV